MDPTSYIAAAGMKANLRALEVMSNNIANSDSPGFKTDAAFYSELQTAYNRLSGHPQGNGKPSRSGHQRPGILYRAYTSGNSLHAQRQL